MKRDFDLVRKLLRFFEEKNDTKAVLGPSIDGYSELEIKYHLVLLHDAKLIRCEPVISTTSNRVIYVIPFELTWDGHEFIATIREDKFWNKVKGYIVDKGGQLTFNSISIVATKLMEKIL